MLEPDSEHACTIVDKQPDADRNICMPRLESQRGKHSKTCEAMRPHYRLL